MPETLRLATTEQVRQAVAWAAGTGTPIEVVGGGSKRALGRPMTARHRIETTLLAGVSLYEPAELVLTAGAGTTLADVEALLAQHGQRLAFEPPDLGPLLGSAQRATLGGTLATNLSGPRRPSAGAARDHFLGLKAVSGRGEVFKSGGRVVKNVTGYDLAKLLAGSFGTLAIMTEVTLKVMPVPEKTRTLLLFGLDDGAAVRALGQAARGPHEVSGLAHLPRPAAALSEVPAVAEAGCAVTAMRLEGPGPSVLYRTAALRAELKGLAPHEELHSRNSELVWREVRDVRAFVAQPDRVVWRLSVPPARGADAVARIRAAVPCHALYDWAGGRVWLALEPGVVAAEPEVRGAVAAVGGHAFLFRARADVRRTVAVFQPQPPPLAALVQRVKDNFDPKRILNPGRMHEDG